MATRATTKTKKTAGAASKTGSVSKPKAGMRSRPKQRRDADLSKERILDVAEEEFSEYGFDFVSVKDLAEAAGVSQGLIHHHFGSKEGLWEAVAARYVKLFSKNQVRRDWTEDVTPEFIEKMFRRYFHYYQKHPRALKFGLWSVIRSPEGEWQGEKEIFGEVLRTTMDAQAAGIIRSDISAFHVLMAFRGMVKVWLTDKHHCCPLVNLDPDDPSLDGEFIDMAIKLVFCEPKKK